MTITPQQIAAVLGGRRVLGRQVRSARDLERVVEEGLPRDALDNVLTQLIFTEADVDVTVRLRHKVVPRATYQRVVRLNLQVSETTERLARLYALALSVFGGRAAAARFLMTLHPELDDRTPFDVALTEIGGREVEGILARTSMASRA